MRVFLASVMVLFLVAACGSDSSSSWPADKKAQAVSDCKSSFNGSSSNVQIEPFCNCLVAAVSAKYTPEQVNGASANSANSAMVNDVINMAKSCASQQGVTLNTPTLNESVIEFDQQL